MVSPQNLDNVLARCEDLAPVVYTVELPGWMAVQLSFLAMADCNSVPDQIRIACELWCAFSLTEDGGQNGGMV